MWCWQGALSHGGWGLGLALLTFLQYRVVLAQSELYLPRQQALLLAGGDAAGELGWHTFTDLASSEPTR